MEFLCLYELCFSMLSIKAFNTCAYPSLSLCFFLNLYKDPYLLVLFLSTLLPYHLMKVVSMAKHHGMKSYWSERAECFTHVKLVTRRR
jgi:hypothetical protein